MIRRQIKARGIGDLTEKAIATLPISTCLQNKQADFGLLRKPAKKNIHHAGWIFFLVNHVSITWNSFLPYLVRLADRLEDLGFRYVDDNVITPKDEADEK